MSALQTQGSACVVGLGAVGLPLALWCAARGLAVSGVDHDLGLLERLAAGVCSPREPGLAASLRAALDAGALRLSDQTAPSDAYLICAPTWAPDAAGDGMDAVREVAASIAAAAQSGALVMVVSTVSPGVTRGVVAAALEARGLVAGRDVSVAHCPERISPGSALADLVAQVRVVGGVTAACAARCAAFWRSLGADVIEAEASHAEAAKLFENTYRYVNIALANELAELASGAGLDAAAVFALANTHPRVQLHRFGVGAGGRCLPMSARQVAAMGEAALVASADAALTALPARLAADIAAQLDPGARVALLGASYKADAEGLEQSPAAMLWAALQGAGLDVRLVEPSSLAGVPLEAALDGADAAVLAVGHAAFLGLDPVWMIGKMRGRLVVDLCRGWDSERWRLAGFVYRGRGLDARDISIEERGAR